MKSTAEKLAVLPEFNRTQYEPFSEGESVPEGWPSVFVAASDWYALIARLALAVELLEALSKRHQGYTCICPAHKNTHAALPRLKEAL